MSQNLNCLIEFITDRDIDGCEDGYWEAGYTTAGWYCITESGGYTGPYPNHHTALEHLEWEGEM